MPAARLVAHRGHVNVERTKERPWRHRLGVLIACGVLVTACGSGDDDDPVASPSSEQHAPGSPATTVETTVLPTIAPATSAAAATTVEPTVATTVSVQDVAAQVETVLADAIAPGAIGWSVNGVDVPPTAMVAAVRTPGRADVVVAVGENLDGSPAQAGGPFSVASLTTSLVRTIALQLVDAAKRNQVTEIMDHDPLPPAPADQQRFIADHAQ